MTIQQYYNIILEKLQQGDYRIGVNYHHHQNPQLSEIKTIEYPLHALNYILFEYLTDHKDDRWQLLFHYVIVPNGVNQKNCDVDFTKIEFNDLLNFMIKAKT